MIKTNKEQLQEIEEAIQSYNQDTSVLKKTNEKRRKVRSKKQVRTLPKISKYKTWHKSNNKLANTFSSIYSKIISKMLEVLIR